MGKTERKKFVKKKKNYMFGLKETEVIASLCPLKDLLRRGSAILFKDI